MSVSKSTHSDHKQHVTVRVFGRVQGVNFRHEAPRLAEGMGIGGYIQNNNDGSVIIEAEADEETLKEFVEWCYRGPEAASVNKIEVEQGNVQYFDRFEIVA